MTTRSAHRRFQTGRFSFALPRIFMRSERSSATKRHKTQKEVCYETRTDFSTRTCIQRCGAGVEARASGVSDVRIEGSADALSAWARGVALILVRGSARGVS